MNINSEINRRNDCARKSAHLSMTATAVTLKFEYLRVVITSINLNIKNKMKCLTLAIFTNVQYEFHGDEENKVH